MKSKLRIQLNIILTFAIRSNSSDIGYSLSSFHLITGGFVVSCFELFCTFVVTVSFLRLLNIISSLDTGSILPGVVE